jgi:hypothetical protein
VPSSRCVLLHQVNCLYLKYNSQNSTYCSLYTAAHLCVMQSSSSILKLAGQEVGKDERRGRGTVCRQQLLYGSRYRCTVSVPNTYIGRYNISNRQSGCNISDTWFRIAGPYLVIYTGQANTYPTLPTFLKYLPSVRIRELDCTRRATTGAIHTKTRLCCILGSLRKYASRFLGHGCKVNST